MLTHRYIAYQTPQHALSDYTTRTTLVSANAPNKHVFKLAGADPCVRGGCIGAIGGCFRFQHVCSFPNVSFFLLLMYSLLCLGGDTDDIIVT